MSSSDEKPDSTTVTGSGSTRLATGYLVDGKYEIIEKVGHGGMGAVYRAKHTLMDREVAVKVLHSHLVENAEFLRRFQHEAQIASKLHHPNAVMIYDFGIAGKLPYLVMEFAQGETLKDLISKGGPIPIAKLEPIMAQVFSALLEAHSLGIVHRDLKPDNFILTARPDGSFLARVLDFGIAKLLQPTDAKAQTLATQAGMFFGTPRYASPEQALGKELDARADIYALGVILYEALTGEVPFDAPSMMELLLKHLNQPPPPVRAKHPELGISEAVEDVVLKCLQKDRDNRYQTIQELAAAFKESVLKSGVEIKSGSAAPIWIMGGVCILIFGGFIYFGYILLNSTSKKLELAATEEKLPDAAPRLTTVVTPSSSAEAIAAVNLVKVSPTQQSAISEAAIVSEDSQPQSKESQTSSVEIYSSEPSSEISSVAPTELPTETPTSTVFSTQAPTPTVQPTFIPSPQATSNISNSDIDPVDALKSAEQFYRNKSYAKAIPLYEKALAAAPSNKKSRLNFGICYLRQGLMDDAFRQFKKAFDFDKRYPPTLFNFACYYALSGQKEAALKWLELAIEQEPAVRRWARSEPDLASIKSDARFKQLLD